MCSVTYFTSYFLLQSDLHKAKQTLASDKSKNSHRPQNLPPIPGDLEGYDQVIKYIRAYIHDHVEDTKK